MRAILILCLASLILTACGQNQSPIPSAVTGRTETAIISTPEVPLTTTPSAFPSPSPSLQPIQSPIHNLTPSFTFIPGEDAISLGLIYTPTPTRTQTRTPTETATFSTTRQAIRATENAIIPGCGLPMSDYHSPDGRWVAVECMEHLTAVYNQADPSIIHVLKYGETFGLEYDEGNDFGMLGVEFWSLDGQFLYLAPYPCCLDGGCPSYLDGLALLRLDVFTGEVTYTLRPGERLDFYNISFSTDGTLLAYFREWIEHPILNIQNLTTGEEIHIPLGDQYDEAGDVVWSPDKSRIAFSARTGQECSEMVSYLVIMDLDDLSQTRLIETPGGEPRPLSWTQDGNIIFMWGYGPDYGSVNVSTGVITPYPTPTSAPP